MICLLVYISVSAAAGALTAFVLAEGLPEGAFIGAMLGASMGVIIAMRRASGSAGPSFEFEAAGIHDDNLITTARRNLVREAYRDSFSGPNLGTPIEQLGSAEADQQAARRID